MKRKLKDGWHNLFGAKVYVEDGLIRRTSAGSLYKKELSKEPRYTNICPCKESTARYYYDKWRLFEF